MKIYVHHYYSKSLLYKLGHNVTNRVFKEGREAGVCSVKGEYKKESIEFVFDPEINDNTDGLHLLDYYTAAFQSQANSTYADTVATKKEGLYDRRFLVKFTELLKDRKGWVITCFSTEKILSKYDNVNYPFIADFEAELNKLQNHYIVSDNIIFNDSVKENYPNHFFALTNTLHQWNELIAIRWYYEYKNIFEKLNQPYDLCYSVRNHRQSRVNIINGLAKLNNNKIYLSTVDNLQNKNFHSNFNQLEKNINRNINNGEDFADISWHQDNFPIFPYMDYFMRILPMAKMHILSETWDFEQVDFTSNYLSEKTYGFLFANIPFISTHPYPLEVLDYVLGTKPHPFYKEIKTAGGDPEEFVKFVKSFMKDFDKNYLFCKEWVNLVHTRFIEKMNTENSLLDIALTGFKNEVKEIKKNLF